MLRDLLVDLVGAQVGARDAQGVYRGVGGFDDCLGWHGADREVVGHVHARLGPMRKQRRFSERLLEAMRRYTDSALTSAQIITELVEMSRDVYADRDRARELGLTEDELAFYDAVATNES
ncbi:MAG: type I restriction enzyme endonuclease domain-containing protein, partial [Thermoplasmata archaeon]